MLRIVSILVICFCLVSCAEKDSYDPARDYFTFANVEQVQTRHIALDLNVDFVESKLRGHVLLHMDVIDESASEIILDTRDLAIDNVAFVGAGDELATASYSMGKTDAIMGTPLVIKIPSGSSGREKLVVRIDYETSPDSTALQWLPPELTAGGEHPMMFSQSQAIHARSWIPLQDTPVIRVTYEADIRTPPDLLAVMSANNDPLAVRRGEFTFEMPQPIPSYLFAIAVGNLYFAPLGEETGVYTEPELLDASVYEFADLQEMLEKAEKQFGPYRWGRYDLLVLPPSFPYGGMENPRLSFLTPSLLAGDRSLVAVVAHELAHSWSGNLVTNATWRDGWLNEGMTSYLEARLMEILYGEDRVDEERVLGYEELLLDFERVPLERQALAPRLDSGDPDDVQGTIHYHKGQRFLEYLEQSFGRDRFDKFLQSYFDDFAFRTVTTEVFLDYLDVKLLRATPGIVSREQVEAWLYQPGLPDDAPIPRSTTLEYAQSLANAWAIDEAELEDIPVDEWSPQALIHFINSLPPNLDPNRLRALDEYLGLSQTTNAEIGRTWFIQVATRRYEAAYPQMTAYLNRFGRTRLLSSIYRALAENGRDLDLAKSIFEDARHAYHPLTVSSIQSIFDEADTAKN
jgi:leukotriene-A4 hydrolase